MKLNRKWLNEEFVDLSGVPDREFVETMTIAGQKVETYERLDAELRNVVVGRVVSITRHTNSDHMWVSQIDVGAGEPVHFLEAFRDAKVDGALAASVFHKKIINIGDLKNYLRENNIEVRTC